MHYSYIIHYILQYIHNISHMIVYSVLNLDVQDDIHKLSALKIDFVLRPL